LKFGEIIVDITAVQFPEVSGEVIVTADHSWHEQFSRHREQHLADFTLYQGLVSTYERMYLAIVRQLTP
jgi:hypothetical protein